MGRYYRTANPRHIDYMFKQPVKLLSQLSNQIEKRTDLLLSDINSARNYGVNNGTTGKKSDINTQALAGADQDYANEMISQYDEVFNTLSNEIASNPTDYASTKSKFNNVRTSLRSDLISGNFAKLGMKKAFVDDYRKKMIKDNKIPANVVDMVVSKHLFDYNNVGGFRTGQNIEESLPTDIPVYNHDNALKSAKRMNDVTSSNAVYKSVDEALNNNDIIGSTKFIWEYASDDFRDQTRKSDEFKNIKKQKPKLNDDEIYAYMKYDSERESLYNNIYKRPKISSSSTSTNKTKIPAISTTTSINNKSFIGDIVKNVPFEQNWQRNYEQNEAAWKVKANKEIAKVVSDKTGINVDDLVSLQNNDGSKEYYQKVKSLNDIATEDMIVDENFGYENYYNKLLSAIGISVIRTNSVQRYNKQSRKVVSGFDRIPKQYSEIETELKDKFANVSNYRNSELIFDDDLSKKLKIDKPVSIKELEENNTIKFSTPNISETQALDNTGVNKIYYKESKNSEYGVVDDKIISKYSKNFPEIVDNKGRIFVVMNDYSGDQDDEENFGKPIITYGEKVNKTKGYSNFKVTKSNPGLTFISGKMYGKQSIIFDGEPHTMFIPLNDDIPGINVNIPGDMVAGLMADDVVNTIAQSGVTDVVPVTPTSNTKSVTYITLDKNTNQYKAFTNYIGENGEIIKTSPVSGTATEAVKEILKNK